MRSFKHSGDAGDIIYSLPVMRCVGGGTLYLAKADFTRVKMSAQTFENIAPLLLRQPYVHAVKMWNGEAVAFDMDLFRCEWNVGNNIAAQHLKAFGLPPSELDRAWVSAECGVRSAEYAVVINRTRRYHNPHFAWKTVMEKYQHDVVFVGTSEEHLAFVNEFGSLPFAPTKTLLELSNVIAGCSLFIGNQSTPYALAEAMKKPVIQEVCLYSPNCIFKRNGAQFVTGERIELPEVARKKSIGQIVWGQGE